MLLLHNSDVFITWEIFKGRTVVNTLSADRTGTDQIYMTGTGGVAHMGYY